jgi:glycosyltransferase involved in cell wall biosynthesis
LFRRVPDLGLAASGPAAESMFGTAWNRNDGRRVLYYGIDFSPFYEDVNLDVRSSLGIPSGSLVIGHVGRFVEQKNHQFFIEIAEALVRKCPGVHFLLIGDGPLRRGIQLDVRRRGLELEQKFTFVADTLSVPRFMISAIDCFVFPSRYEGLGLVAVEAQAAGLPCIIADRVPVEAIVDPSLVKVLSLDQSPEEWAEGILNSHTSCSSDRQTHLGQFENSIFNISSSCAQLSIRSRSSRQSAVISAAGTAGIDRYHPPVLTLLPVDRLLPQQ